MKKILIAVDDTKNSKNVISTFMNSTWRPVHVILLNVQRILGRSPIIDMLGDPEIATLKESLEETEYKASLDRKSEKILAYYKKELENLDLMSVKTLTRIGQPTEEILKAANEENVDLILIGHDRLQGFSRFLSQSVAESVKKEAHIPVIVAKKPSICEEPYSWKDAYEAVTVTTVIFICLFLIGVLL